MSKSERHEFNGRLVMVGFGCVGQAALPLLRRHVAMPAERICIVTADDEGLALARQHGVAHQVTPVQPENVDALLGPRAGPGDLVLNVSVDVASAALIEFCQRRGALYLDTCIEPWAGGFTDRRQPPDARTIQALRAQALALRRPGRAGPTAVLTHGANPGLVSHFTKQALVDIAAAVGAPARAPTDREGWAALARRLGVKVIHVSERDTQVAAAPKSPGEFVNTWSVDGLVGEGCQPAELGWGTHERHWPTDAQSPAVGGAASIYLPRPGAGTRVRSWTPLAGPLHGWLIAHNESISIAEYLTDGAPDRPEYRPTVHYAYRPCDDAVLSLHELAESDWREPARKRVLKDEIVSGVDELGVLLMGHARGAYWYGSRLSIEQARAAAPNNSATSLQVAAAVVAGVVWAMRNPACGIVESDDLPYAEVLDFCRPYLGDVFGVYTDWTPLAGRERLFDEDLDRDDPWQFKNFRVG